MAFVVEDGSVVEDANSYVSVGEANAYFTDRGITAWTGTDAVKEAALIRATDYLDMRFGENFIGDKVLESHSVAWPRTDADPFSDDEIPLKLRRACCEYAVRALAVKLAPDPLIDDTGLPVVASKERVGPIERGFFVPMGPVSASLALIRPYPEADMLLRGLLRVNNMAIR